MPGGSPRGSRCSKQAIEQSEAGWLHARVAAHQGRAFPVAGHARSRGNGGGSLPAGARWARRQEALSWELRAATSLARLLRDQGRPADAIACLQPVYDRFTEGFGTADLIAAKQLLDEIGDAGRR